MQGERFRAVTRVLPLDERAGSPEPRGYHRPITAESVSTLRGASVAVDHRRVGRVVVVALLAGLVVASGALYAAGAHKNAQVASLRDHGVSVEVTVTGCLGQLGGSGSNAAGYSCRGTFVLGHRQTVVLPDGAPHSPGDRVREVTVASDPGLVSPPALVASSSVSWTVFVLPTILLVGAVLTAGAWFVSRRRDARTR